MPWLAISATIEKLYMALCDSASSVKNPVRASTVGVSTLASFRRPRLASWRCGTCAADRRLLVGDEKHDERRSPRRDAPRHGERRLSPPKAASVRSSGGRDRAADEAGEGVDEKARPTRHSVMLSVRMA